MSHNTQTRPSDGPPPCPDCESDVFVDRSKGTGYVCRFCGGRFEE